MRSKLRLIAAALALNWGAACAVGDPELERRGGPPPPGPVTDDDSASGGASGAAGDGATGASGADGGAAATPIAFCDALEVIRAKCQRCHGDPLRNGAPVPFLDFDDLHAQYYQSESEWWQVAIGMVERDSMPYVALNGSLTLEGGTVEPLTPDEKDTLLGWLKQGALPEGGTVCP